MKPQHWVLLGMGLSFPIGVVVLFLWRTPWPLVNMLIFLAIVVVSVLVADFLSKRLPSDVLFDVRVDPKPSWHSDFVLVTSDGVEVEAVSGSGRMAPAPTKLSFGFKDLLGIGVRPAVPDEPPWITLIDGRGLPVPSGEVVVLRTTSGEQVLPLDQPQRFVSLVRSRVSGLPDVRSAPVAHADGQLPELGEAPPPVGDRTVPVPGPSVLSSGPALPVRWLIGATLALTGTVVLPAVALIASSVPRLMLAWVGVAGVVWVLNRNVPRVWGRVAILPVPLCAFWLGAKGYLVLALVLLVCPALGYLGGRMFRLGANLGKSVEVRVPLRSGAELRVQRDRLVLQLNKSRAGGVHPHAMWLGDVSLVQTGNLREVQNWPLPDGVHERVGTQPLLRLVAGPQQWILPADQAGEAAALIKSRLDAPSRATAMSFEEWKRLRTWAAARTTGSTDSGNYRTVGIGWRLFAAAFTGSFGWNFVIIGFSRVWFGVVVGVGLTVLLLGDWWRVRPRMRVAEHNVLPPGSPDWGETRPDHAPLPGWQPWS